MSDANAPETLVAVLRELAEIKALLLRPPGPAPEPPRRFYTTEEAGALIGRSSYTVREWCRLGRMLGEKRAGGAGDAREWMVSAEEVERYRNEGLRPGRPFRAAKQAGHGAGLHVRE